MMTKYLIGSVKCKIKVYIISFFFFIFIRILSLLKLNIFHLYLLYINVTNQRSEIKPFDTSIIQSTK